jgi:hypothetical protein
MRISGSLDSVFFQQGDFPFDIRDTLIPYFFSRDNRWGHREETRFYAPTLTSTNMKFWENPDNLTIVFDYSPGIGDDEDYFHF